MATGFATLSLFTYSALAAREICVLVPHDSIDDGLVWSLKTVSLDDRGLRFDALLYLWGPQVETFAISCNGSQLRVHHNIYSALPYLAGRYKDQNSVARPLWIDAICINQEDEDEKTSQVKLMNAVYRQFNKVWVWLSCTQTQNQQEHIPRAVKLFPLLIADLAQHRQAFNRHFFKVTPELRYLGHEGWAAILHQMHTSSNSG